MKILFILLLIKFVLSQFESSLKNKENFIVTFTVSNPTAQTLKFLTWDTPFDEMQKDMFNMVELGSGKKAIYDDRIVMRTSPLESSYMELNPHSSKSIDVDLSKHYLFPVQGTYLIKLEKLPQNIKYEDSGILVQVSEDKAMVDSLNLMKVETSTNNEKQVIKRINCNASDNKHVDMAVPGGVREARCAFKCLRANTCDPQYLKWFGVKTAARYQKVTENFDKIAVALTQNFGVHCRHPKCTPEYWGWVYSNDPERIIYLCPTFFNSKDDGSMFTHEISHFTAVTGTSDHAYGDSGCKNLARSDPGKAIENADSYSYFGYYCLR